MPPPQIPVRRIRRAGAPSSTVTRLPACTGRAPLVRGAREGRVHPSRSGRHITPRLTASADPPDRALGSGGQSELELQDAGLPAREDGAGRDRLRVPRRAVCDREPAGRNDRWAGPRGRSGPGTGASSWPACTGRRQRRGRASALDLTPHHVVAARVAHEHEGHRAPDVGADEPNVEGQPAMGLGGGVAGPCAPPAGAPASVRPATARLRAAIPSLRGIVATQPMCDRRYVKPGPSRDGRARR